MSHRRAASVRVRVSGKRPYALPTTMSARAKTGCHVEERVEVPTPGDRDRGDGDAVLED
jgi:hypothetical protein